MENLDEKIVTKVSVEIKIDSIGWGKSFYSYETHEGGKIESLQENLLWAVADTVRSVAAQYEFCPYEFLAWLLREILPRDDKNLKKLDDAIKEFFDDVKNKQKI